MPVEQPSSSNEVMSLHAHLRRVGMLLMAQNPRTAEYYHGSEFKEIDEVMRRGEGVVRCEVPGQPVEYIVVRNGTRYTTTNPPKWAKEDEILTYRPPEDGGTMVLETLKHLGTEISKLSTLAYEQWDVQKSVETIERYSKATPRHADLMATAEVSEVIAEVLQAYPNIQESDKAAGEWAVTCLNRLAEKFLLLRLPGDAVRKARALLQFFALHPAPLILYRIGIEQAQPLRNVVQLLIPRLDLGFYLSHPHLAVSESLIVARGAARFLRRQGKEACRTAVTETSITGFYEQLYQALLYYRSAQQIYEDIEFMGKHVPDIWNIGVLSKAEVRRYWGETEEARVAILVSLDYAAIPRGRGPNPTRPPDFFWYIDMMLRNLGRDEAEMAIYDMVVQLVCPELLRDLGVAWLHSRHTHTLTEKWINRLAKIIGRLEADLVRIVTMGDPNYLIWAYELIGTSLKQMGREDEANSYGQRAKNLMSGHI